MNATVVTDTVLYEYDTNVGPGCQPGAVGTGLSTLHTVHATTTVRTKLVHRNGEQLYIFVIKKTKR